MEKKNIWKILKSYFTNRSVAFNQINSYDEFIHQGIQDIIDQEPSIEIGIVDRDMIESKKDTEPNNIYSVHFGHVSLGDPTFISQNREIKKMYPHDARSMRITYDIPIYCDITTIMENTLTKSRDINHSERVLLARVPLMLHSSKCSLYNANKKERMKHFECPNDPGGYFIINGKERVLVGQVRGLYNKITVLELKNEKYTHSADMRSMSTETNHSVLIQAKIDSMGHIVFSLPYFVSHDERNG